jgi:pseudomonalisin
LNVTAPSGWAATATQAIPLVGTDLGVLSSTQAVTIRVGLQLQNVSGLKSQIASRKKISRSAFVSQYGPTSAQVSAVSSYLSSQGFANIKVEPNNVLISATGTAAQAATAFNTTLHSFNLNGATVFANVTPAYVPSSLAGQVVAVLGLNNVQSMQPPSKFQPQPTACSFEGVSTPSQACLRFYDPPTFQLAYDAPQNQTGNQTTVAVMSWGDPAQAIQYLQLNEQEFNLPPATVNPVQVGTYASDAGSDADSEWTLDMTYSTGMAQQVANLYIYHTTSGTDSDVALNYSHFVSDNLAQIGNSSFGECEVYPYLDGAMVTDDELFAEAAAQGQTMFVSTGDTGGFCPVDGIGENGVPAGGAVMVNYPAASPYVVAVGGTDLFSQANGTYQGESGWESGGGGISQFEYGPSWESPAQTVNSACSTSGAGCTYRGTPDVAMDASLETAALLYGGSAVNGSCTPCTAAGTSLASPLAAGSYARMQSGHNNQLGFAAPLFYNNYYENAAGALNQGPPPTEPWGGFHVILTGTNGVWTAQPGYSYLTGLGSFDISVLNSQIGM